MFWGLGRCPKVTKNLTKSERGMVQAEDNLSSDDENDSRNHEGIDGRQTQQARRNKEQEDEQSSLDSRANSDSERGPFLEAVS